MNDDDKGLFPIGQLVMKGPDGKDIPIQPPVVYGAQVVIAEPPWNYRAQFGSPYLNVPIHNQEVVELCRGQAVQAGKGTEFLDAMAQYRPYVTREDALALLALARVGLDPTAVETVFIMSVQEERRAEEDRMGVIQKNLDAMARSCGVAADKAAAQGIASWPPGPLLSPHSHLEFSGTAKSAVRLDFTINPPDHNKKP